MVAWLCYTQLFFRSPPNQVDNFIRRTIKIRLCVMLINHNQGFVHCDFSFYLLTGNLNKKVRHIKTIHTLQSDSNCSIISPFSDKWG